MKKITKPVLTFCCVLSFLIYSCTKENNSGNNSGQNTQSASDNSFAEATNNDVLNISTQSEDNGVTGSYNDSSFSLLLSPCANISIDNISTSHKMIIDFGADNCLCYDGKYRHGKILVSYTGLYRDSGSMHTITFGNYYVNNYKVEGTHAVVNNGYNAAGNLTFSITENCTITDTADNKLTYTSVRKREWVAGESTAGIFKWMDDVYSITGTASGTSFDGTAFTSNITSSLIVALNCKWIEKGAIEFTPAGEQSRMIDFGNGDCDNKITVSIAGFTFNISLP